MWGGGRLHSLDARIIMSKIPHLIEVSLEERKGSGSSRPAPITKKLITAVSIEAPDLFRIHGVPCVDRGPDKLRLPVAFEHWRVDGSARREDFFATGAAVQPAKKTSNFARPSSVSEDAPNFFKVRDKKIMLSTNPGKFVSRPQQLPGIIYCCCPCGEERVVTGWRRSLASISKSEAENG